LRCAICAHPEVHAEIARTLREEFHDIARQARDETRPSGE